MGIYMATENNEKEKGQNKRLTLGTRKNVRASLCKLMRARYNGTLETGVFRDMVYSFNALLAGDKLDYETETNKRLDALEKFIRGESGAVVDSRDIDNPYAHDLKLQLAKSNKDNEQLRAEIMELRGLIAKQQGTTD
jgi:hypothetical protein